MPRPCKQRRICSYPACSRFIPLEKEEQQIVIMTLDEYESIRLIDFEEMTQEECAAQMNLARTTAQAIYGSARKKLAQCIVTGSELRIEGGNYVLCEGNLKSCRRNQRCGNRCLRRRDSEWRSDKMKIAVTYEDGQVFQHFGHCENFKVYEVEGDEIREEKVVSAEGNGHGALAGFLMNQDVKVLICGGIGGGARMALAEIGIDLYPGVTGNADEAVKAFLKGTLSYDADATCSHHHGGDHKCGENKHGCAGNQ